MFWNFFQRSVPKRPAEWRNFFLNFFKVGLGLIAQPLVRVYTIYWTFFPLLAHCVSTFLPFFAFVYKSKKVTNILQKFYGMMIATDEKWRQIFFFAWTRKMVNRHSPKLLQVHFCWKVVSCKNSPWKENIHPKVL